MHKEVHRKAFQGMHQEQGELYQANAARLKAKAVTCGDELCTCVRHKKRLDYRDEMVGHSG